MIYECIIYDEYDKYDKNSLNYVYLLSIIIRINN